MSVFLFKLVTFSKGYVRKQKWVFFSEHSVGLHTTLYKIVDDNIIIIIIRQLIRRRNMSIKSLQGRLSNLILTLKGQKLIEWSLKLYMSLLLRF